MKLRHLAPRLTTGAYVLNSGLSKRGADEGTAAYLHGSAVAAYPFLARLDAATFTKLLSTAEIAVGAALLVPVVPTRLAALGLTGLSAALVGLYVRTPALHGEGYDLRPTPEGIGIAKDVMMLGTALGLLVDGGK